MNQNEQNKERFEKKAFAVVISALEIIHYSVQPYF